MYSTWEYHLKSYSTPRQDRHMLDWADSDWIDSNLWLQPGNKRNLLGTPCRSPVVRLSRSDLTSSSFWLDRLCKVSFLPPSYKCQLDTSLEEAVHRWYPHSSDSNLHRWKKPTPHFHHCWTLPIDSYRWPSIKWTWEDCWHIVRAFVGYSDKRKEPCSTRYSALRSEVGPKEEY